MTLDGLDGMRYLGADPRVPADNVEQLVMVLVQRRIIAEHERMAKQAG